MVDDDDLGFCFDEEDDNQQQSAEMADLPKFPTISEKQDENDELSGAAGEIPDNIKVNLRNKLVKEDLEILSSLCSDLVLGA